MTPFDKFFKRTYDSTNIPRKFGDENNTESYLDYYTVLTKGASYIFEHAVQYQPKFYNLIKDCDFFVGEHHWQDIERTKIMYFCFTVLNGNYISLNPEYARNGVYETYEYRLAQNPPKPRKLQEALPKSILMVYYNRLNGLGIAEEPPFNPSRLLGKSWHCFDTLASFHNVIEWEKYLPLWLPEETAKNLDQKRMRTLLDTRCIGDANMIIRAMNMSDTTVALPYGTGDALMVDKESSLRRVYHIHRGRFDEPRVLIDPAEAIDSYVEHTLLNREEPFDFLPYSQTFKQAGFV